MNLIFRVFRAPSARRPGHTKDWAWADCGNGRARICWGDTDAAMQCQKIDPAISVAMDREAQKTRRTHEQYAFVGEFCLDQNGQWVPPPTAQPPRPTVPTKPIRVRPQGAPVDIVELLGGDDGESFYF